MRDLLVKRLPAEGLSGVLLVVWEHEGQLHSMTTPPGHLDLGQASYAELFAKRNRRIPVE